jgi:hypothetical protein
MARTYQLKSKRTITEHVSVGFEADPFDRILAEAKRHQVSLSEFIRTVTDNYVLERRAERNPLVWEDR